jgi:hypothetical protein
MTVSSESELLNDLRFTANQFVFATHPLRPTTRIFVFQLNTCSYSPYETSSLTRRWVCRSQLLLVLASAVILRSVSHGMSYSMVDHYRRFRRTLCIHIQNGNVSRGWKGMVLKVKDWQLVSQFIFVMRF